MTVWSIWCYQVGYIDSAGRRTDPPLNCEVVSAMAEVDIVVYAMGSFFTSILPMLVLKGIDKALIGAKCPKVLITNGFPDRETGDLSAKDQATLIVRAVSSHAINDGRDGLKLLNVLTDIVYASGTRLKIENRTLESLGLRLHQVQNEVVDGDVVYNDSALAEKLVEIANYGQMTR